MHSICIDRDSMHKSERQVSILSIINSARISRQEELVRLLRRNGFDVTQASVSRDLDELGIVKVDGIYSQPGRRIGTFDLGLISVSTSGNNLVVAKCHSGLASATAVRIDAAKIEEIVGTIAGDDTIFIAVKDEHGQRTVIKKIWELFEGAEV